LIKSRREELEKALSEQKGKIDIKMRGKIFDVLKKEFGDYELSF